MEMASTQLAMRMIGSVGRLDQHRMRTGRLEDEDWEKLTTALGKLNEAPIFIENIATGKPVSSATFSAILIENAVLPMDGRPATIIKSPP